MVESDRVHIEASLDDRVAYILQVHTNYTKKEGDKVENHPKKDEKVMNVEVFHFPTSVSIFSGLLLHLRWPWGIKGNSKETEQASRQKDGTLKHF